MKIGIQMRLSESWPIESWQSGFEQLHQWGYEQVELPANGPLTGEQLDLYHLSTPEILKLIESSRSLGLDVWSFQCHHGFSIGRPQALRDEIVHVKRMIDAASAGNVPVVHVVSGMAPPYPAMPTSDVCPDLRTLTGPTMSDDEYWQALKEVFVELLDHAAGKGVKLGVEQVFAYKVCNRATLRKIFELVGRDDFYWNLDPGHFVFHDESYLPAIEEFGGRIASVHMKDAKSSPDPDGTAAGTLNATSDGRRFEFVPPGTGQINQAELVRTVAKAGYDGALILELPKGFANRAKIARDFVPYMRGILEETTRR